MKAKSVTSELQRILRDLPHMKEAELEAALDRLSTLGIEEPKGPVRRPGIICPFTQMQVVSPCSLRKCKFHIENEWSRNCMLEYLDTQNSEALASEEIAFLYDTTTENVDETIEQAMVQLRENPQETVGFSGNFHRASPRQLNVSIDEEGEFEVTRYSLAPPFLGSVNTVLENAASDELVTGHPAIKLLGVLEAIISELE